MLTCEFQWAVATLASIGMLAVLPASVLLGLGAGHLLTKVIREARTYSHVEHVFDFAHKHAPKAIITLMLLVWVLLLAPPLQVAIFGCEECGPSWIPCEADPSEKEGEGAEDE